MKPFDQLTDDELLRHAREAAALPDAPPGLIRKAIAHFDAARPATLADAARALARRIEAALTFDSWAAAPAALGVRAAAAADTRHLLYSAQGRDIDVRISPAANYFALTGQILGPDEAGTIELASIEAAGAEQSGAPSGTKVTTLDALGEFRLEGIPGGSYVLTLRLGDDEIVLPPIELGSLGARRP